MAKITIYDWRRDAAEYNPSLPYEQFIAAQYEIVQKRLKRQLTDDVLVLAAHPPTITLGARSLKEQLSHIRAFPRSIANTKIPDNDLLARARMALHHSCGIDLVKTSRGGSVWYHGPGVLQLYLIAEVPPFGISDIVFPLEELLLRILNDLRVPAARMDESLRSKDKRFIGIWVGEKKIAAIGIRIEHKYDHYVSMFGASLNINPDMSACEMIDPCGIPNRQMTSVARELGNKDGAEDAILIPIIRKHLGNVFGTSVSLF
ncbi:MAG: lipoyl(octanoyl) transferase LipB [bacterium]|nr:lipoyl(octanoyl) transferase LipB [bacterium]MDZ4285619.1 lipoyl(octanoyl) transferase LipB [Candidatus Sungbacteria bacterium]